MQAELIQRLRDRDATIGIVGLGYVGLPLMLRYIDAGYRVLGLDIDTAKVEQLNRGESYIRHIGASRVAAAVAAGFEASSDYSRAAEVDALLICVPTPLSDNKEPDLSFVIGTIESLAPHLRSSQVLSLESTTWPGTTEEVLRPRIEAVGREIGEDFFLVYSPEREDPGNPDFTTQSIPKICGGSTPACLQVGMALYGSVIDVVVPVSSTRTAEMTKLLENIHRAVNIGLVNEMKMVADRMGVDIHEVIQAAATKPFGFVPYLPGPGLGGHCIPVDPFYLTWKAREYNVHTRFIELAGEVNSAMPAWVVGKLADALNDHGKAIRGSRILVLGIAYKKDVDDPRESPAIEIMQQLRDKGAEVAYSDPYFPEFPRMRRYAFDLESVELDAGTLEGFDCVLLATDHGAFDYPLIAEHARLIVDTRGKFDAALQNLIKA